MEKSKTILLGIIVGLVAVGGVILMTPKAIWSVGTVTGTGITNADDAGTPATADVAGDLVLTSDNAPAATAPSTVSTTVLTGYDVGDLATPVNTTVGIGSTVDYTYSVKNLSNGTDTIRVTIQGSGATVNNGLASDWTISIISATDSSTLATGPGNLDRIYSFGSLASNSTLNFNVRLQAPGAGTAFDGYTYTVNTQAESNNGSTDTWDASDADISANPFGGGFTTNGDSLLDSTTTTVQGPVMFAAMSVDNATELPGNSLTYTIQYDNDGLAAATNVAILSAIPDLANVTYSLIGTILAHTGATVTTTEWNDNTLAAPNYVTSEPALTDVVALRWTFNASVAAHSGGDTIGVADGGQDSDSGTIEYNVTIN